MSEAQPNAKKIGGHAYGRRNLWSAQLTQLKKVSSVSMPVTLIGRFSSTSMRFDSHQACCRCVASAREGRMSFDIGRLLKKEQKRALKFWSQVEIGAPDECWNWNGCINKRTGNHSLHGGDMASVVSTQHHPQRVAMWFTWGDLGFTGVKTTCGNKYCCNPFHLIPQKIGVFVDHDSYLESFELACQLHTLKQQVAEYVIEEGNERARESLLKKSTMNVLHWCLM